MEPFMQSACCTVLVNRKPGQQPTGEITRMSDAVFDGIYFFGGKNNKGEMLNKLKYLKPLMSEDKVLSVDWQKIK